MPNPGAPPARLTRLSLQSIPQQRCSPRAPGETFTDTRRLPSRDPSTSRGIPRRLPLYPDEADWDFGEDELESRVYSRDQRRSRRKRAVRAKTINTSRLAKSALELGRRLQPEFLVTRPRTRGDCSAIARPCPFVSCRYHLYLDVSPRTGSIKLNFPDLEVWDLSHSCALDVAEHGPLNAEQLGVVMNLTRERIRQLQQIGLERAFAHLDGDGSSLPSRPDGGPRAGRRETSECAATECAATQRTRTRPTDPAGCEWRKL